EVKQNPVRKKLLDQLAAGLGPPVAQDWRKVEQWVDCVQGGISRRSLICRGGRPLSRNPLPPAIERLYLRPLAVPAVNQGYLTALIDLHEWPPRFVPFVSEKPKATPLARFQARESTTATNAMNFVVQGLNRFDRVVLSHLNGARDRAAVLAVLRAAIGRGIL